MVGLKGDYHDLNDFYSKSFLNKNYEVLDSIISRERIRYDMNYVLKYFPMELKTRNILEFLLKDKNFDKLEFLNYSVSAKDIIIDGYFDLSSYIFNIDILYERTVFLRPGNDFTVLKIMFNELDSIPCCFKPIIGLQYNSDRTPKRIMEYILGVTKEFLKKQKDEETPFFDEENDLAGFLCDPSDEDGEEEIEKPLIESYEAPEINIKDYEGEPSIPDGCTFTLFENERDDNF